MLAEGRCVVPRGLDSEFGFAVISLCAADSVIVICIGHPELPAIASRRNERDNTILAASGLKTSEVLLDEFAPLGRADCAVWKLTTRLAGEASRVENWAFPVTVRSRRGAASRGVRVENSRIGRFLALTLVYPVGDGSLSAQSLVDNQRAGYWPNPKAVLSKAIVAVLVVFREVSPL